MNKRNESLSSPWSDLDELGTGLTVNNFLTTKLSQLSNALRRSLTTPYAEQFGLSVSEWRLLSLVAHADRLPFGELVAQSTSDKALVSRTVRLLEERGLIKVEPEDALAKKRLQCRITNKGKALHSKIIPIARASQAQALRVISPEERDVLFGALGTLLSFVNGDEKDIDKPANKPR